jgi:aminoglycoside phosphotransferase (APT) family kinase protein
LEVPTAAALTRDLERRFPDSPGGAVRNVQAVSGGNSKQTVMFEWVDVDGRVRSLVMRRDRPNSFVGTSVADEFPIVRAVHAAGFPVPEPLWLEDRSPFIPGTFMVSRRGLGTAAGGPDGAAAGLAGNPLMMLAGVLARLHGLALGDLASHGVGIDAAPLTRQTVIRGASFWFDRYRAEVAAPSITLECAHRWLCEHADLGVQPAVMVHGDAGFHNILVSDGEVTALLDWELAHPGAAAEDLCRCREFIERLGPFEEFLRCYGECGGTVPPAPVLRYYDMFIMARNAEICTLAVSWFNRGMSENLAELNVFQRLAHFYILRTSALLAQVRAIDGFDAEDGARD